MSFLQLLVADLEISHSAEIGAGGGVAIKVVSFQGRSFGSPIELAFNEAELAAHLDSNASDASSMYPDASPIAAAYRLFLVHIEEIIITKTVPGSRITLAKGSILVHPQRPLAVSNLDPRATYRWTSEPPGGHGRRRGR